MNIETTPSATVAFKTPRIVPRRLPEDVSQAQMLVTAILSLNDDTAIEPGHLQGMSRVLSNAKFTRLEMRGWGTWD